MGNSVTEVVLYTVMVAIGVLVGLYLHHAFFHKKLQRDLEDNRRHADAAVTEVARLKKQLAIAKRSAKPPPPAIDKDERQRLSMRVEELEHERAELDARQRSSQQQLQRLLANNKSLQAEIDKLSKPPKAAKENTAAAPISQVDDNAGALRSARRQIKRLTTELDNRNTEAHEHQQRIQQLVAMLDKRDAEVDTLVDRLTRVSSQLEIAREQHRHCDATITRLSTAPAAPSPASSTQRATVASSNAPPTWVLPAPQHGTADDLKKVHGIGPVLESLLNNMGVFHFWQIAQFSSSDEQYVANQIKTFPNRIRRDDWIGQSVQLAKTSAAAPPPASG